MKTERHVLEDVILVTLNKLNAKQLEELQRACMKYNLLPSRIVDIIDKRLPIQEIGEGELFWLCDEMHSISGSGSLIVKKYFTEKELQVYPKASLPSLKVEKFPVRFENIQRIKSNQWQCVMSIDDLMNLKQRQVITYNPNTQRPLIVIEKGEKIITKVDLNKESVVEIMKLMEQGFYNPHHITINLNKDLDTEPIFSGNDMIIEEGQLDIIDGYHNYIAATRMKAKYKDFEYYMPIIITHFDERQAGMYIAQENKKNIINTNYTDSLDITNIGNLITERINDNTDFYLYGKIGKQSYSQVPFAVLSSIIKYYFKSVKQGTETTKLVKELTKYWNDIIDYDQNLQEHKYNTRDIAIIVTCFKNGIPANTCIRISNLYGQKINLPLTPSIESSIVKLV